MRRLLQTVVVLVTVKNCLCPDDYDASIRLRYWNYKGLVVVDVSVPYQIIQIFDIVVVGLQFVDFEVEFIAWILKTLFFVILT